MGVFEQAFKNIDDVDWKVARCTTELYHIKQISWRLFLPAVTEGRERVHERLMRRVAAEVEWGT